MSTREQIIDRIEKIMRKTRENGCTEAEVEAAARMARKLMDEHNVELAEVLAKEERSLGAEDIVEEVARKTNTGVNHEVTLINVVSDLCDVKGYMRHYDRLDSRKIEVVFVGLPVDIAAAKMLYLELVIACRALARGNVGPGWSKKHYWYCHGFVLGLAQKIRDDKLRAKSKNAGTALVVVKDQLITEHMAKKHLITRKARSLDGERANSREFRQGVRDGREYDARADRSQKINGRDNTPRLN